jgi:predicted lipoprotein
MRKWAKYSLVLALIVLVGYNSVYVTKLSEVKNASKAATFDAVAYARNFLHKTVPANKNKAIDLPTLCQLLATSPRKAFSYSHAQNNGNTRFFMVKGEGDIIKLDAENAYLGVAGVTPKVLLATEYIIGNAARDGSGLISVDEFTTTMDMNNVSEELNKLIRTQVLPPFKSAAKQGDHVLFTGCMELQQNKPVPDSIEIIPLVLTIK